MKRIIWESYFDSSLSRKYGRRVKKGFQKDRILEILNSLGLSHEVKEGHYPKSPYKKEKFYEVEWNESKEKLIKRMIQASNASSETRQ
ncbi:MAG: hypothetical protein M1515_03295 [Candidatus Thermoplasmatota archaeon]|jgi:signal recognition particle subunit SEC65|nr:hypothetical protein [Candidatus Thermoplasmatota archaeon]